jgi:hypothetical protein
MAHVPVLRCGSHQRFEKESNALLDYGVFSKPSKAGWSHTSQPPSSYSGFFNYSQSSNDQKAPHVTDVPVSLLSAPTYTQAHPRYADSHTATSSAKPFALSF